MQENAIVEGFGNEALLSLVLVGFVMSLGALLFRWRNGQQLQTIHPESQRVVDDTRQVLQDRRPSTSNLSNGHVTHRFTRNTNDNQCPVCLNDAKFACETNCGHMFCGRCLITYWRHGTWLGAVRCPVCRQQVNILLTCFTESELNSAEPEEIEERNSVNRDVHDYNRRFSGEPLALYWKSDWMWNTGAVRKLDTLLRQTISL